MKSQASFIQGLYTALFEELRNYYPASSRQDWDRDENRLSDLVQHHGVKIYTIFLPDLCKSLDLSLSRGMLRFTPSPVTGKDVNRSSPRLFRGLWRRIFEPCGRLKSHVDEIDIKFLRQMLLAAKKLKVECDDHKTYSAVSDFFIIESEARPPSLNWLDDHLDINPDSHLHLSDDLWGLGGNTLFGTNRAELSFEPINSDHAPELIETCQRVADLVSSQLGLYDPLEWANKHGPGAVSDQSPDESKYSFRNWPEKLNSFFPIDQFAYANIANWGDEVASGEINSRFSNHEPPSKLLAVPKTQKGPRLIASEPTAHQWAQQSVNVFLRTQSAKTALGRSLQFRNQSANQNAALRASRTGSHWTVDLSSASDRMSLWAVERIFRRNRSLLEALHASRTRWLVNNVDKKSPKYVKLRKFAPQGSAITFPLQSIMYAIVCVAAEIFARGILPRNVTIKHVMSASRTVQIFGDDLVVPKGCGEYVLELLEYLGFEVNRNKTHRTGKFRESCGVDAYNGTDVSPAYIARIPDKSRPESMVSCIETHNNFVKKGLWLCAEYLKSTLLEENPQLRIPQVPLGSVHLGWYSVFPDNSGFKTRIDQKLQRREIRVHRLFAKTTRSPQPGNWSLLQYFTEQPSPDDIWTSGFNSRLKLFLQLEWVPVECLTEVRSESTPISPIILQG